MRRADWILPWLLRVFDYPGTLAVLELIRRKVSVPVRSTHRPQMGLPGALHSSGLTNRK